MRTYLTLGPCPAEERCAQVGEDDYEIRAFEECKRYRDLIRKVLGNEPQGAQLAIKSFPHDFGRYVELVVYFEDTDQKAVEYAYLCESKAPTIWLDEDIQE